MTTFYYKIALALKDRDLTPDHASKKEILVEVEFDASDNPDYWEHEAKSKEYVKKNHPLYSMSSLKQIDGHSSLLFLFPNQKSMHGLY